MTCPRCLHPVELPGGADFCPHCGLGGFAEDRAPPQTLAVDGTRLAVGGRVGIGDGCTLYECAVGRGRAARGGVFKIARDAGGLTLANERKTLDRLHAADARLGPFAPAVAAAFTYRAEGEAAGRPAVVLTYHDGIRSPHELYSLEEVRIHYPAGVDARDMAWVWRRLLTALIYVHEQATVHAAVTPGHVLIEPKDHKLVLIGWGNARPAAAPCGQPPAAYREWFEDAAVATFGLDIRTGARTMLALLGHHLPDAPPLDPALDRYFDRCLAAPDNASAVQLLLDFDRLIETLWGPRQFRPFAMPPRGTGG